MNMRNIYIYMLLAVTTLTLSSCDDFLDKLPDNRMDLNSKEKVQKYLVSAYPDHNPAYLTELYSDNADEFDVTGWGTDGIFQDQAFAWKDITETQDKESPQELWNSLYMAMGTANTALQTIEQSGNSTSSDYQASKGEACFAEPMPLLCSLTRSAWPTMPPRPTNIWGFPTPCSPKPSLEQNTNEALWPPSTSK